MGRFPICTIGLGTSSAYPRSRIPAPPQKRTTFMAYLRLLIDRYLWNRHDKAAAPLSNEPQLLHDLVFQVPGQDHDILGLGLTDPVRMMNRNTATRQESPLLVRAAIHCVLDQILTDAAVMQQSGALARRAIAGYLLALHRCREQKIDQCELRFLHLLREAIATFRLVESGSGFVGQHLAHVWLDGMGLALGSARIDAERSTVRSQFLHVEHSQSVRLHDLDRAEQREV